MEVYEGGHIRLTGPRDGRWTPPSSRMRRTGCNTELASTRVEGGGTDQPEGREGIVNPEPSEFAGIGRERAPSRTIFMTSSP